MTEFTRDQDMTRYEITPFGAAMVEAMPDKKKKTKIRRDFDKKQVCPTSLIFNADDINKFYMGKIRAV